MSKLNLKYMLYIENNIETRQYFIHRLGHMFCRHINWNLDIFIYVDTFRHIYRNLDIILTFGRFEHVWQAHKRETSYLL